MPRVSRAEAERSRRRVIDHTARLIREKGPDQVSVPEAMAAAGLTHGGFYRHFASKDDLLAQALAAAFTERREAMERLADRPGDQPADRPGDDRTPRAEFLDRYLSEPHRDHPGHGCTAAALAADAARTEPGSPCAPPTPPDCTNSSTPWPHCPKAPDGRRPSPTCPPWSERCCSPAPATTPHCPRSS